MRHDDQPSTRSLTTTEWTATDERSTSNWLEFACCALLFVAHMSAAAFVLTSLGKMLVA